jgi:signal transduction histidine kinase
VAGREQGPGRSDAAGSARPAAERSGTGAVTESSGPVEERNVGTDWRETAGGRWRLRNWRLRSKLTAVLLIPAVLALVFAGLRVAADASTATDLAKLSAQVQLQGRVNDLVHELQRERDLSVLYVASGRTQQLRNLKEVRSKVDDRGAAFQQAVRKHSSDISPAAAGRFSHAVSQLHQLSALRGAVENTKYPAGATGEAYTRFITPFLDIGEQAVAGIESPELVRMHLAANAVAQVKEYGSQRRELLLDVFRTQKFGPQRLRNVQSAEAKRRSALQDFQKFATNTERTWYDSTVTGPLVDQANKIVENAITHGLLRKSPAVSVRRWDNASTVSIDLTHQVQQALHATLSERTDQLAAAAKRSAVTDGAIVLAVLALAALFALFVARSLLRPLRTLRRSALAVAEYQLPEEVEQILADSDPEDAARKAVRPVPVYSREEVGQVARAFDAVHGEAVRQASQQALLRDSVNSMFVNLSRRSQALVERQLSVIDRLEADEQDPDQLGSLFELDHLATRMRRNSENLLVLSGTEFGRRMSRPVPVTDVLGAAVSEVEQYARIELTSSPDLAVVGQAVNDIVHLVAELLDNATVYSDPQTNVGLRSVRNRAGAWAIEISDSGVGMSDADLAAANERLAEPPEVDVSVSRRMGLYVVARLSKQHDITVSLRENEDAGGGVIARVLVPPELVRGAGEPAAQGSSVDVLGGGTVAAQGMTVRADLPALGEPDQGPDLTGPAMTSPGIEGAFGLSPVRGGTEPEAPAEPDKEPEPVVQQANPLPQRDAAVPRDRKERINRRLRGAPAEDSRPEEGPVRPEQAGAPDAGTAAEAATAASGEPDPARDEDDAAEAPARQVADPAAADFDGPTERLPIYEQVLSQWFTDEPPSAGSAPATRETPRPDRHGALPARVPGVAGQTRRGAMPAGASSYRPGDAAGENGTRHTNGVSGRQRPDGWQSPADEGWQAVQALDKPAEELTGAGLPKRRPRAQLVPGSAPKRATPPAAATTGLAAPSEPVDPPPRSADDVRGRMSSLQQGVRRGRHALTESYPDKRSRDTSSKEREQQ